jgi:hypothetical protein
VKLMKDGHRKSSVKVLQLASCALRGRSFPVGEREVFEAQAGWESPWFGKPAFLLCRSSSESHRMCGGRSFFSVKGLT